MRVLAVIPARFKAKRFPGKPLIDISGKSMIRRVYEQVCKVDLISTVVVATDDERIAQEVESFGGSVVMTSPDHPSGTDRCAEVLESYPDFDVLINVQGDEPVISPLQISELLGAFQDSSVQIASMYRSDVDEIKMKDVNCVKVVMDSNAHAKTFFRSHQPSIENVGRHIGIYAFKTDLLLTLVKLDRSQNEIQLRLEQMRWLDNDFKIKMVETNHESKSIDTPEDLEALIKHYFPNK